MKPTIVYEVQLGSVVQHQSVETPLLDTEPECTRSCRCKTTGGRDTFYAVLDLVNLISEVFRSGTQLYAKKISMLVYRDNVDTHMIRNKLKSVTSYRKLLQINPVKYLETKDL